MKIEDVNKGNPLENVRTDYTPTFAGVVRANRADAFTMRSQRIFRASRVVAKSGAGLILHDLVIGIHGQLAAPVPLAELTEQRTPANLQIHTANVGDTIKLVLENPTDEDIAFHVELEGRSLV